MMLKLRTFLPYKISRIYSLNTYSSKTSKQLEETLSLADALGTQTTSKPLEKTEAETNINPNLTSSGKSLTEASKSEGKDSATGRSEPITKKGKRCGHDKPTQPPGSQGPPPPGDYKDDDICDVVDTHRTNAKKWRNISYVAVPFAFGLSAYIMATKEEQSDPEYIPYEYMYRRTKRFAWRDGKTSLFHGRNNLIPEEEEARIDREEEAQGSKRTPRYKKRVNEKEEKIKRREQRAEEEVERPKNNNTGQ